MPTNSTEKNNPQGTVSSKNFAETNPEDNIALDSLSIVVGEIAHDFNNVLSLIFGYVEMALSEIPEGERARSDLEHVLAAGDRAKELVARILTFSNQNKLKQSDIQIAPPVLNAIANIRDKLPGTITLQDDISNKQVLTYGNASEISQIVTNLCNNSIQAIGNDAGTISVSLDYLEKNSEFLQNHKDLEKKPYARLTVKDDGCGMDIEILSKIYVPFFSTYQGDEEMKKRAGLGMTTIYNIVTSMKGSISIDSEPGNGTTVEILFPLVGQDAFASNSSRSIDPNHRPKHILFIDDEVAITQMAEQMLIKGGYTVTTFNDGNKALKHFSANPHEFDLVITDLVMPSLSGTELSLMLSEIKPHMPIILTTGFSEKITSSSCKKWGISLVMSKPFIINDLLTAIESIT